MDRETFDVMWKMSAPDSPTQHLFMRIPQTEFYTEPLMGPSGLEVMPDVSFPLGMGVFQSLRFDCLGNDLSSSKSSHRNSFLLRPSKSDCSSQLLASTRPITSTGSTKPLRPQVGGTSARRCSTSSRSSTARLSPDGRPFQTR